MELSNQSRTLDTTASKEALERIFSREAAPLDRLVRDAHGWRAAAEAGARWRARFQDLVVVGIGGSSLGAQVLCSLKTGASRVRFIENVDPWGLERALDGLDLARTGFVFVSKSGRTIETLACLNYLNENLTMRGLRLEGQSAVMTAVPSSPLGVWAAGNEVEIWSLPEDVSGRFSVFTMAGLFPAAFDGLDLQEIREGALAALATPEKAAAFIAEALESFTREEWISLFWFYENRGRLVGAWLQQLWAESLAKKVTRSGGSAPRASTPLAALGTVDQHSLLQQVVEGARDKWVVFFRFDETEQGPHPLSKALFEDCRHLEGRPLGRLMAAEARATEGALKECGIPTMVLKLRSYDPSSVGQLLMFFQQVVAGIGEVMGIDPFNQPGVELGKVLALKDLSNRR